MRTRLAILSLLATLAAGAQTIPPSTQLATWQGNVGVPGGIPTYSTVYASFTAGASTASIQAALNACPIGQVVYLGAGSYTLTATLTIPSSGVVLRGATNSAGVPQTTLTAASGLIPMVYINSPESPYEWATPYTNQTVYITNGLSQGATTLKLAGTNRAGGTMRLPLGRLMLIDQLNDANTSAWSVGGVAPAANGIYTSIESPNCGSNRYQQQVVMLLTTNADGTTITVTPPIFANNWSSALAPQIWWMSAQPITNSGIENITVSILAYNSLSGVIELYNTYGCWVKNCNVNGGRRMVYVEFGTRDEIRHCTLTGPCNNDSYGFAMYHCSGCLVEDNISNGIQNAGNGAPIILCGCSGSVFGYNYCTNFGNQAWQYYAVSSHGNHNNFNLFEGNVGNGISLDNTWGSSGFNTVFRNYWSGWDEAQTTTPPFLNNVETVVLSATNRNQSVVGNVLGGQGTMYEYCDDTTGSCDNRGYGRVYFAGWLNSSCGGSVYDPVAWSSAWIGMNWDAYTAGIVSGGYTIANVPNSLYLASKPSNFGGLAWPPVDPTNLGLSKSRTNTPAAYRLVWGVDPPGATIGVMNATTVNAGQIIGQ